MKSHRAIWLFENQNRRKIYFFLQKCIQYDDRIFFSEPKMNQTFFDDETLMNHEMFLKTVNLDASLSDTISNGHN